jgi:hypothetical protein
MQPYNTEEKYTFNTVNYISTFNTIEIIIVCFDFTHFQLLL